MSIDIVRLTRLNKCVSLLDFTMLCIKTLGNMFHPYITVRKSFTIKNKIKVIVTVTPCVLAYKDGKVVGRIGGFSTIVTMKRLIESSCVLLLLTLLMI